MSSWQERAVQARASLIELFLSEFTNRRYHFSYITDLASAVSRMIESHERVAWDAYILDPNKHGPKDAPLRKPNGCSPSTLLRNDIYRLKLNAWWTVYGQEGPQKTTAKQMMDIRQAKLEIGLLKNKLSIYRTKVENLENELSQYRRGESVASKHKHHTDVNEGVSNDTAQTCKALHLLLREFEAQVIIHNNQLVTNSFAKRIIVPSELLTTYCSWIKLNESIGKSSG